MMIICEWSLPSTTKNDGSRVGRTTLGSLIHLCSQLPKTDMVLWRQERPLKILVLNIWPRFSSV